MIAKIKFFTQKKAHNAQFDKNFTFTNMSYNFI